MDPHRNLLVHGINELLINKLIALNPPQQLQEEQENPEKGHYFTTLCGHPSMILWSYAGFGELRVSVWWKYNHTLHPQANLTGNAKESFETAEPLAKRQHYIKFVGVTVSGWLERKEGKHLQGKGKRNLFGIYTRAREKNELERIPVVEPLGYKPEGKFYF